MLPPVTIDFNFFVIDMLLSVPPPQMVQTKMVRRSVKPGGVRFGKPKSKKVKVRTGYWEGQGGGVNLFNRYIYVLQ